MVEFFHQNQFIMVNSHCAPTCQLGIGGAIVRSTTRLTHERTLPTRSILTPLLLFLGDSCSGVDGTVDGDP